MVDRFRRNVLTVLGAIGYLVFLGLVVARTMGIAIGLQSLAIVLLTASTLLGIDFGIDILPISTGRNNDNTNDSNMNKNTEQKE